MIELRHVTLLLIFTLTTVSSALAQISTPDKELVLSADSMSRTSGKVFLVGNVQAIIKGNSLSCDQATIDVTNKRLTAVGNIKFIGPEIYMEGEQIDFDYQNMTGDIVNGFAKMGQITFEGEMIRKTGPKTYEVIGGKYTSCSTCPPAWSFTGSEVSAEVGGYAHIKNSVFRIVDIPVFWFPYLIVPLKSDRQTGFLFPEIGFSNNHGLTLEEEFFWAMSDNQDATIGLTNYQKRGLKGNLNYRYLLSETSGGELDFSYMTDAEVINDEYRMSEYRKSSYSNSRGDLLPLTRTALRYRHHYELPNNYFSDIDVNLVSDALYPRDFPKEMPGFGDAALENRASLSKNGEVYHMSLDNSYYYGLLESNALTDNSNSVHRLPDIKYNVTPVRLWDTPLFGDLYINYVNFSRENNLYDDVGGDSGFDPDDGDLYRTGQRVIFRPRISAPFNIAEKIDVIPALSYEESRYEFGYGQKPSTERRLLRGEIETKTRFSRIFTLDSGSKFRHQFEPIIRYTNLPWQSKTNHPFFPANDEDPFYRRNQNVIDEDADNGLLQFDYDDRIVDRNIITYAINNTVVAKTNQGSRTKYNRIFRFQISQSYDFYEAERNDINEVRPWGEIETLLDVVLDNFASYNTIRYYPYQNEALASSRSRFWTDRGEYVELNYSQDFNITSDSNLTQRTEDLIARAGFITSYFDFSGNYEYSFLLDEVRSWGARLQIKPPGKCWAINFNYDDPFERDPDYSFDFELLYDGTNSAEF